MNDSNLIEIILHASPVVQAAMIILAVMSLASWSVALAKSAQIRKSKRIAQQFEKTFRATQDLQALYYQEEMTNEETQGLSNIFVEGFKEFGNLKKQGVQDVADLIAGAQRSMRIAFSKEADRLEHRLTLLATVGSSAPYIGLFGTVWGVMHAFQSLGDVQHATLAAVAPGISEALIATAIGLFAAIPAVIYYNRLSTQVDRLLGEYENFADGLLTILQRQAHSLDKKD